MYALQDGISKAGESRVLVIGATNRPMDLDSAALRRFQQHLYVPLPDRDARKALFSNFAASQDVTVKLNSSDVAILSCDTVGYSAADIVNIIKDACMWPLRAMSYDRLLTIKNEELAPVSKDDVKKSIQGHNPTCREDVITKLEEWKGGFQAPF